MWTNLKVFFSPNHRPTAYNNPRAILLALVLGAELLQRPAWQAQKPISLIFFFLSNVQSKLDILVVLG